MINSYKELTIAKYDEIMEILKKDMEEIDKQVELISVLSDMSPDDIYDLPIAEYHELVQETGFLFNPPKPKPNMPKHITINGKKYVLLKNVEKMTTGQYIDLQSYMKNDLGPSWVLTTILIPDGSKYGDGSYDVSELEQEVYKNLDIETALSIAFFLQRKLQRTINASLVFLDWKMKRMEKKMNPEQRKEMEEARKNLKDLKINGTGSIL